MGRSLNILFSWEIGQGLGHLWRHRDLARVLQARGHQVAFAVKDLGLAATAMAGSGLKFAQAPQSRLTAPYTQAICSHADILALHGLADPATCSALFNGWAACFQANAVDLAIIDHAPAALFAAKCLGIKTLVLATGFCVPLAITPFPSFRPRENRSDNQLLGVEAKCLSAMNPFAAQCSRPPFTDLAQALTADLTLLTTFAELDHYPQRRGGRYIGPTESYAQGEQVVWQSQGRQRVFVYLHHVKQCEQLLTRLTTLDIEVIAYCPDLTAAQRQALATPLMNLAAVPVALAPLLETCDLAITNGGHGVVSACVLQGVPVLAIPLHMEQRLMVDCLRRCGMGDAQAEQGIATQFNASVQRLLSDTKFRAAGLRLKQKYHSYNLPQTLERLANTVEELVNAPQ